MQYGKKQFTSIQLLLNDKANPNLVNCYNETPLHEAITVQVSIPTVELLLLSHANPNLKNGLGNTPLHQAAMYCEVPEMAKAIQLLLQYSAQVDDVNNQQLTPLQLLAHNYYNDSYSSAERSNVRKVGRLLVWH